MVNLVRNTLINSWFSANDSNRMEVPRSIADEEIARLLVFFLHSHQVFGHRLMMRMHWHSGIRRFELRVVLEGMELHGVAWRLKVE